jgi:hypothetical protein
VDGKFLMAFEHHQIVSVSFVISEEKILAVGGVYFFPIFQCKFYCREGRVMVSLETYPVCLEEFLYFFCLFANHVHLFDSWAKIQIFMIIFV